MKVYRFIILLLLIILLSPFIPPQTPETEAAVTSLPFGGKIQKVQFCNEGVWLIIGPPRPLSVIVTGGSRVYPWYQIYREQVWTLGITAPAPILCTQGNTVRGAGFPVIMIGTSLLGGFTGGGGSFGGGGASGNF